MDMNNYWFNAIYSLVPTLLVGLIFWFIVRAIIKSDSRERAAYAKYAKQEREAIKRDSPASGDLPSPQVGEGENQQPSSKKDLPELREGDVT